MAAKILAVVEKFFKTDPPDSINLGGGFFSNMPEALKCQFEVPIPSFEDYAAAIGPHFAARFCGRHQPQLILEPGLALVADCMRFAAKVVDIKTIRGRAIALLSGSVYNVIPTKSERKLPITVISSIDQGPRRVVDGPFDLVGYTCMEDDVLAEDHRGSLAVGDYVLFNNVGAYTLVLKPSFIAPCPPVLAVSSGSGRLTVVKRAEDFEDIFATHVFQDHAATL